MAYMDKWLKVCYNVHGDYMYIEICAYAILAL